MANEHKDTIKRHQKLSCKLVANRIEEKNGNIKSVARSLGWSRASIYRYIEKHPTLQDALHDARETMKDNVQSEFYRVCLDPNAPGHVTAMIFFLKTQSKDRGFVERSELAGVEDNPVSVMVYIPDNKRD
jgi:hypothetical protein